MQTSTVLLIILAAIVALGLVLFQYYSKTKNSGKLVFWLSFLRFISLYGLLLLVINPKFSKNQYEIQKSNLIVLTDNSSSVAESRTSIEGILNNLQNNASLSDKFKIQPYNFDNSIFQKDSLLFDAKNTNIAKALKSLDEVYANSNSVVVLLTDGNSTIGEDYVFAGDTYDFPIYPIAIGDTTRYEDLRIDQVNSNKYAFLKNKYPLEIYISFEGNREVNTTLSVTSNGKNIYRENIKLSRRNNSKTINTLLDASSVGLKNINITLSSLNNERNIQNNSRNIVVEVIDEKTNVALITNVLHPDIGALRKSIESNEQRSVRILKPTASLEDLDETDIFILYQPDAKFTSLYNYIRQKKAGVFTIGGTNTDWNVINKASPKYRIQDGFPTQEISGVLNPSFSKFDIADFSLEDFPPLNSDAGPLEVANGEALIQMKILGSTLKSPLLFAVDTESGKEIVLLGENIWKWRVQSFRNEQNFQNFDEFIGKLMVYLSSNKSKNRLNLEYETVYEGNSNARIKASYFDEAFVFDANASLLLKIKNTESGASQEIPMLLKNNFYEADLTDVAVGKYAFTVQVEEENRSQSGSFTILDFDVEKQFLSTNYKKLTQLATASSGKLYFPSNTDNLMVELARDNRFVPTQKATKNIVSLIDFRVLLALIIAALASEWFLRKYNGLT